MSLARIQPGQLRLWLWMGNAAAILAAVPLLMSALMTLTAGGLVCGQMPIGIQP